MKRKGKKYTYILEHDFETMRGTLKAQSESSAVKSVHEEAQAYANKLDDDVAYTISDSDGRHVVEATTYPRLMRLGKEIRRLLRR